MLSEFLSELKLSLKMNGLAMVLFWVQTRKAQERKLICKRKRDAKRRFQACVRRRRIVNAVVCIVAYSQLLVELALTEQDSKNASVYFFGVGPSQKWGYAPSRS